MNRLARPRSVVGLLMAAALVAGGIAHAEITVSVTLSGPLDEVLPILQQLNQLDQAKSLWSDDTGRLQLHSSISNEGDGDGASDAGTTAPSPATPLPAFTAVRAAKSEVAPGESVLVTVDVDDPDKAVDTVVAVLEGKTQQVVDLYDNGTHGDVTAQDGTWSTTLAVPTDWAPGDHTVRITGYDAFGAPVNVKSADDTAQPLTADLILKVVR